MTARQGENGAGETVDGGSGGPLLLIFAHPDDETFGCAGTLAAASARGVPATLICATRGEAGKTGIPELDTPEILAAVREEELRAAAAAVGARDVRFLDYRDSGMAGTPENDDPRAFSRAPEALVVAKLVVHLRAFRPATVVTFGPDGIYGHHDHLAIRRAAAAAVRAAAEKGLRLENAVPAEAAAHSDRELVALVLQNLLGNAVKFTESGGRVSIACETDRQANVLRVRVRDTGRGIPADQLERIFEPFVQVRADLTRPHDGAGLGLAISRDLARGMGGDLTAESTPGAGSTFTLLLSRAEGAPG